MLKFLEVICSMCIFLSNDIVDQAKHLDSTLEYKTLVFYIQGLKHNNNHA